MNSIFVIVILNFIWAVIGTKILYSNCQGVGHSKFPKVLREYRIEFSPNLVCLLELISVVLGLILLLLNLVSLIPFEWKRMGSSVVYGFTGMITFKLKFWRFIFKWYILEFVVVKMAIVFYALWLMLAYKLLCVGNFG